MKSTKKSKAKGRITREEINAMPIALRALADQIQAPDYVPAMVLRDAADMIEALRTAVADAVRRPLGVVPELASWLSGDELEQAEARNRKERGR